MCYITCISPTHPGPVPTPHPTPKKCKKSLFSKIFSLPLLFSSEKDELYFLTKCFIFCHGSFPPAPPPPCVRPSFSLILSFIWILFIPAVVNVHISDGFIQMKKIIIIMQSSWMLLFISYYSSRFKSR
jgi:hypothetical protein